MALEFQLNLNPKRLGLQRSIQFIDGVCGVYGCGRRKSQKLQFTEKPDKVTLL